jgi:hypothetical protein
VKSKQQVRSRAAELYTSTLFRLNLQYARQLTPDAIYILSAKHGLLPLDQEIEPYELTLNRMGVADRKAWAMRVLGQLETRADLEQDHFIILAGARYREYLLPHLRSHEIPLEGLPFGMQLQELKRRVAEASTCDSLHRLAHQLPRLTFPFEAANIPKNGLYILFEQGETGHGGDRIVRVGTHTGDNQLRSRLQQHFIQENKDRSIFRKNIGRALLNRARDPFLEQWNWDLTTRKAKDAYGPLLDRRKQQVVEEEVTAYIQGQFSFVVLEVQEKAERLTLESRLISTVS